MFWGDVNCMFGSFWVLLAYLSSILIVCPLVADVVEGEKIRGKT